MIYVARDLHEKPSDKTSDMCDVCQKRFPGPAHLKRHSNVHEKT